MEASIWLGLDSEIATMNLKEIFQTEKFNMTLISQRRKTVFTDPLFYYHIPKSAGLTFRYSIMFGQMHKFKTTNDQNLSGVKGQIFDWDVPPSPSQLYHSYCSVVAWKPYGFHEQFKQKFNLVTVVRDPFDRLVSRYRYKCNVSGINVSPEDFENFFRHEAQINHQSKLLSGSEDSTPSSIDFYDRSIEHLDSFLAFGPIAKVNDMLENLISLYDLPNVIGQRMNVTPERTKFDWEPYRDEIMDLNRFDKKLFDYVCENYRLCAPSENVLYEMEGDEGDVNPHTILIRDADKERMFSYIGLTTKELVSKAKSDPSFVKQFEEWLSDINSIN